MVRAIVLAFVVISIVVFLKSALKDTSLPLEKRKSYQKDWEKYQKVKSYSQYIIVNDRIFERILDMSDLVLPPDKYLQDKRFEVLTDMRDKSYHMKVGNVVRAQRNGIKWVGDDSQYYIPPIFGVSSDACDMEHALAILIHKYGDKTGGVFVFGENLKEHMRLVDMCSKHAAKREQERDDLQKYIDSAMAGQNDVSVSFYGDMQGSLQSIIDEQAKVIERACENIGDITLRLKTATENK